MPLDSIQRKLLRAIDDLERKTSQTVGDKEIAAEVGLDLQEVRDGLDLLKEEGYIGLAKGFGPVYSAWLEARGRIALRQPSSPLPQSEPGSVHISSVGGNVTISQNQQGGVTAHSYGALQLAKSHPVVTALMVAAAIATILTYFGLIPSRIFEGGGQHIPPAQRSPLKPSEQTKEGKAVDKPNEKVQIGEVKGDAVISINQSGGVTAHTVVTSPPPRTLTERQRDMLIATLKQYSGAREIETTQIFGDPEAKRYGEQVIDALATSGWALSKNLVGVLMPPVYGVVLQVQNPSSPSHLERFMIDAFKKAGITIELQPSPTPRQKPQLIVGLRPVEPPR